MSGPDSSLNFDWLKREVDSEMPPSPSSSDSSTSLAEEAEPAAAPGASERPADDPLEKAEASDAFAVADELPDPQLNESDGSTLVIHNRDLPPLPPPPPPVEEFFHPPAAAPRSTGAEEFSPPVNTDDSSAHAPGEGDSTPIAAAALPPADESSMVTPESRSDQTSSSPGPENTPGTAESTDSIGGFPPSFPAPPEPAPAPAAWPVFEPAAAKPDRSEPAAPAPVPAAPKSPPASGSSPATDVAAPATVGGRDWKLVVLASYASALTLAVLFLLLFRGGGTGGKPHHLESLPDIPPEKVENLSYVPVNAKLAPGHTLALGEQCRFGNVLIEPLKITREPIEFVHYSGNPGKTRPPTSPVWKLWIKVTNVSRDQTIAPLDRRLVLRWVTKAEQQKDFTNYYITDRRAADRDAPSVQLYRLPLASDWDMKDEDLGKALGPGESYTTYLASAEDGLDKLGDNLVWRVQIRKGYSPQGNGVTTVFEVAFKKSDVSAKQS